MKKNLILYFISVLVITMGGIIYQFAISFYILNMTNSPFLFSLNIVIMSLGAIISLPIMGTYIDSLDRKKLIITLEAMSALTLLIFILYIIFFGFNIYFLFFITALRSVIIPVTSNTFDASLTQLFDEEKIQNILGQVGSLRMIIGLLGPVFAGVLYGFLSLEMMVTLFFIFQLLSLFVDFFLTFKPYEQLELNNKEEGRISLFKNIFDKNKDAIKYIKETGVLWNIIILAMLINGVGAASFSVLPETLMIKELSFEPLEVGIASAIMGLGSLISALILSKVKIINPLQTMKIAFLIVSFMILIFSMPVYIDLGKRGSIVYIATIGMMISFTFQFVSIPLMSYMQKTIANEYKGRVFSIIGTLGNFLMPIGTIIFGALYELEVYFLINLFSSIVIIMTTLYYLNNKVVSKSKWIYNK